MGWCSQLHCIRCGAIYEADTLSRQGCEKCASEGSPANLACELGDYPDVGSLPVSTGPGIWRYASLLPAGDTLQVSLGEGSTPLLPLSSIAESIGVSDLWGKNEAQNPTWSHKDRLCAVAVTAAMEMGATAVTAASTGNHGASLAAYAAKAGLPCVLFTVSSVPQTMKILMQVYGAEVVALKDASDRYVLMNECIQRFGWFPVSNGSVPPIGSTPFGVDGYKTIAYELWEQSGGRVPDWVVIPVAYGDCLAGTWRGFQDLRRLGLIDRVPRMAAAEVFGAAEMALKSDDAKLGPVPTRQTHAFSIGGGWATQQTVDALRESNGVAATVGEDDLMSEQLDLGSMEGLYVEASSSIAVAAIRRLVSREVIKPSDYVVALLTSSGLKDPAATSGRLRDVPVVDATVEALEKSVGDKRWASLTTPRSLRPEPVLAG